jgi:hypothetical protein
MSVSTAIPKMGPRAGSLKRQLARDGPPGQASPMWFAPPRAIPVRAFARMPEAHRRPRRTAWSDANRGGAAIDSFL